MQTHMLLRQRPSAPFAKPPRYGAIGAQEPVETLASAILRSLWGSFLKHAAAAAGGNDADAIHDARVALRRLRSALRTFGRYYSEKRCARVAANARTLARALGVVRDADVHLLALRSALAEAAEQERVGVAYAIERVQERRAGGLTAFGNLVGELDSEPLETMLEDG